MTTAARTAVVGAGVVGLAVAFRLQQRGHDVLLIDRAEPGSQCSFGNAGHIATEQVLPLASPDTVKQALHYLCSKDGPLSIRPSYLPRIAPWLLRFLLASRPGPFARGREALGWINAAALPALRSLLSDAGLNDELQEQGHLLVAESPRSLAAMHADSQQLATFGVPSEVLNDQQVRDRVPGLTQNVQGARYFPATAHVRDPYKLSQGLLQGFLDAGGELKQDEVRGIDASTSGFRLSGANGTTKVERIVISAGAWSKPLAAQLGHDLPLDTERGYHLQAPGWQGEFDLPIASWDRKTIMTPLAGGLRITGFVEFGGLELPPSPARVRTLRAHLEALLPDAGFPPLGDWMGFRPSLPDHLPVIGRSERWPGALFAFGHQHLGLTLSAVTADLVAALADNREPAIDIHAFRPGRFG